MPWKFVEQLLGNATRRIHNAGLVPSGHCCALSLLGNPLRCVLPARLCPSWMGWTYDCVHDFHGYLLGHSPVVFGMDILQDFIWEDPESSLRCRHRGQHLYASARWYVHGNIWTGKPSRTSSDYCLHAPRMYSDRFPVHHQQFPRALLLCLQIDTFHSTCYHHHRDLPHPVTECGRCVVSWLLDCPCLDCLRFLVLDWGLRLQSLRCAFEASHCDWNS